MKLSKSIFRWTMIYNVLALFALISIILLINYYQTRTLYSNYIYLAAGSTILISSTITLFIRIKYRSLKEILVLVSVTFLIFFVITFIALNYWKPLFGVIGTSTSYFLMGYNWLVTMYFWGIIGKKYKKNIAAH